MNESTENKNILVYRIGHLGDTIVSLPAFWSIRKRFPVAKITLLTNSDSNNKNYIVAKNILPTESLFDGYISYDSSDNKIKRSISYLKLFVELKRKKYDALYYLSTRNRTSYQIERDIKFFTSAGIKKIYGAENVKRNQLNFQESKPLPVVKPEYQFLLECLPFYKENTEQKICHDLVLNSSEKKNAELWLKQNCGENYNSEKLIAVAPGSKWASKIWSENKYIEVLKRVIEKFNVFPLVLGGNEDFETGQRILQSISKGANAAGKLNIRESFAALEKCILYLGNDTGTMHMAAAVETPCVAIFAATDYIGRWYPFGESNEIFREMVECEGCHTPFCFNKHKCLELISVEKVFDACGKILKNAE